MKESEDIRKLKAEWRETFGDAVTDDPVAKANFNMDEIRTQLSAIPSTENRLQSEKPNRKAYWSWVAAAAVAAIAIWLIPFENWKHGNAREAEINWTLLDDVGTEQLYNNIDPEMTHAFVQDKPESLNDFDQAFPEDDELMNWLEDEEELLIWIE